MNYYSKRNRELFDTENQKAEIPTTRKFSESNRETADASKNEMNRLQFIVPWQMG